VNRRPTGCYVHLPFCDRICPYCDFAVVEFARPRVERYLKAVHAELALTKTDRELASIYLGGGTPSALSADDIAALLSAIFKHFDVEPGSIECTLEANPSRNAADLGRYREAGINRLSIGVQSFDDAELHRLGRDHTADQGQAYLGAAREAGHRNVGIDVIAGAPGQTAASFERTLRRTIECAPEHVSVYGLTIEAGTPYARWFDRAPHEFPDDDATADLLELAEAELTAAGFSRYEISNYAKSGFESDHNRGYWHQRECVALGMSASGYEDGSRYRNLRSFDAYCTAIEAGGSALEEEEKLDFQARLGEAAMLCLRTREGIRDVDFRTRFGVDPRTVFEAAIDKCRRAGLLEEDGQGVRLSSRGRLLANTACSEFLHPSFIPAPAGIGKTTS
jgi:oxygen-independent coproporphyrinogen-3 oxidase